jgi:hypothetical protein
VFRSAPRVAPVYCDHGHVGLVGTLLKVAIPIATVGGVVLWLVGPRYRERFWREWARPRLVAFGVLMTALAAVIFAWRLVQYAQHH